MAADVEFTLSPAWTRPGWPPGLDADTRVALDRVGGSIVRTARRLCPKGSDPAPNLMHTIRHEVDSDSRGPLVRIQAGGQAGPYRFVDYASFVEAGTSRMAAQPYLRPAVDQAVGLGRL